MAPHILVDTGERFLPRDLIRLIGKVPSGRQVQFSWRRKLSKRGKVLTGGLESALGAPGIVNIQGPVDSFVSHPALRLFSVVAGVMRHIMLLHPVNSREM